MTILNDSEDESFDAVEQEIEDVSTGTTDAKKTITGTKRKATVKITKTIRKSKHSENFPQPKHVIWYDRIIEVLWYRHREEIGHKEIKKKHEQEGNLKPFLKTMELARRKAWNDYEETGINLSTIAHQLGQIISDSSPREAEINPILDELRDPDNPLVKFSTDGSERYSLTAVGRRQQRQWELKKEVLQY